MNVIDELAKQGFIGAIAAGELTVIIYLFKRYIEQLELRRTDTIQYRDQLAEPMKGLQQTLDAVITILKDAGKK